MPRAISPSASESTLPCSEVRISASSLLRAFSSSRKANSTVWRLAIEASRHSAQAAEAESTAVGDIGGRCEPHLSLDRARAPG